MGLKKLLQEKYNFESLIYIGQGKLLKKLNEGMLCFFKSLPWLGMKLMAQNYQILQSICIVLSQYCVQKCLV
jgi:hypothetical protein